MRLVDADALIELLEPHGLGKGSTCGWHSGIIDIVIDEISKMPTIGGWISVKDRLPEKTERYMCLCYDFVTKSYWYELLWHENNRWWESLAPLEHDYTKHVTHWMPLPEPPKEEGSKRK